MRIIFIILLTLFFCDTEEIIKVERMTDYNFKNNIQVATVRQAFDYVFKNMRYVPDQLGQDYWQLPEESYHLKTGDCEDFCILFMYLCDSIGIASSLVSIYHPKEGYHAIVKIDEIYYEVVGNYITYKIPWGWSFDWKCTYEEAIWMTYYYHDGVGIYE